MHALLDEQRGALQQARDRFHEALALYNKGGELHRQARVHQLGSELCHIGGHDAQCEQNHNCVTSQLLKLPTEQATIDHVRDAAAGEPAVSIVF